MLDPVHREFAFLSGNGEMAALIREHDWAATSLGPPASWSASLRAMVRMALSTKHPVYIFWGEDHAGIYNDAYRVSLGPEKHPAILGRAGKEGWPEIWSIIGPQIEFVRRGEGATWHENQLVPILRFGEVQDVYWTYSFAPIDDDSAPNGIGGVLVICTETTRQVALEKRITAEKERLATMFREAPTFMAMLIGPEYIFEHVNPAYMKLTGHRDVIGKPVAVALPETVGQGYIALLDEVYRSGKAFIAQGSKYELQVSPGGPVTERFVDFVYQPVSDTGDGVSAIFVIGMDVTERMIADRALRHADRRKDEFLATLAHELRNPLAPIRTAAHLLSHATLTEERTRWCTDMIVRQSGSMALLLDDLLEITRITTGKLDLRKEHVSIEKLVNAAVETARPVIDARDHDLTIELPDNPPLLEVDPLRMSQVLTNLLTNAAKYTDPGGKITIAVVIKPEHAVFEVIDNGVGLLPESLPTLFEMFGQVRGTVDRAQGGLGIGLALSKGLVELHGGSIQAFSEGPYRGSVFRATVPLPATARPLAKPSTDDEHAARPSGKGRLLVVDDNVDGAQTLALLLELEGYQVDTAHDGHEAFKKARDTHPDAIFLDIGMPALSGHQVAARIRAEAWGKNMLLVATTGWGQEEDRQRALVSGFDFHLTKPIDPRQVFQLLADRFKDR